MGPFIAIITVVAAFGIMVGIDHLIGVHGARRSSDAEKSEEPKERMPERK